MSTIKELKQQNMRWINISSVDAQAVSYLKEHYNFHHLDMEDIQSESQTPKLDVYKNYLFLVLQVPQWKSESRKIIAHELDIFLGDNYLITVQHGKNKEVKSFFYRCMNNRRIKADWMSGSSGYLLYRLMEALFNETRTLLNNVGKQVSGAENEIFAGEQDLHVIKLLAMHRRNVLTMRRMLDPQRYLMSNLSHIRKSFLDENMSVYFDDVKDQLDKIWAIVESYKETIDGLHLTVESIINQRTNKVISALTVISVALLPLTLLSGIYGMNITGLPYAERPQFVWGIFAALALVITSAIIVMRRRKWL